MICSGPSAPLLISAAQRDVDDVGGGVWGGGALCGPGPHSLSSPEMGRAPVLITEPVRG